jgi:tRNA (guanine37-N1)-methyltransferase
MKSEKSLALLVPLKKAETVRRYLLKHNLLRKDLRIHRESPFIYLPIQKISAFMKCYEIRQQTFLKKEQRPSSYKELLDLPVDLHDELPTSYDIIGTIILIKLPQSLYRYKEKIGDALLQTHSQVTTVCLSAPVCGELRTRKVSIIAGKKQTRTVHREYGLRISVDVQTCYFSPRLATERKRVAELVQDGETIVDMFTGVAPFSVMIARYAHPKKIYAVDKNKDAVLLASENIRCNNVVDMVEAICTDAEELPSFLGKKGEKADRIIMNLPFSAWSFFPVALQIASDPCIVHYYDILPEETIENRLAELCDMARHNKMKARCSSVRKIKSYAPREFYIGVDITVEKEDADVA